MRFMKAVFQSRPTRCKYGKIGDVNIVLSFIENLGNNTDLCLKTLL